MPIVPADAIEFSLRFRLAADEVEDPLSSFWASGYSSFCYQNEIQGSDLEALAEAPLGAHTSAASVAAAVAPGPWMEMSLRMKT